MKNKKEKIMNNKKASRSYGGDYDCFHPWDEDCYVQCSGGEDNERYHFFEAFPVKPVKTFIRGDGKSVREAEDSAWEQYQKIINCPHHEFKKWIDTSRIGVCIHCNYKKLRHFLPTSRCSVCEKEHVEFDFGINKDSPDKLHYFCKEHFLEKTKSFKYELDEEMKNYLEKEMKKDCNTERSENLIDMNWNYYRFAWINSVVRRDLIKLNDLLCSLKYVEKITEEYVLSDLIEDQIKENFDKIRKQVQKDILNILKKNDKTITLFKVVKLTENLVDIYSFDCLEKIINKNEVNEEDRKIIGDAFKLPYHSKDGYHQWYTQRIENITDHYLSANK